MPSKATKKRRQAKLQQAQVERSSEPRSVAGSQQETSEYGPSISQSSPSSSTASSQQQAAEHLERLVISDKGRENKMCLVPKPPPNEIGKAIRLISNHYPLKIPNVNIYHYDVEIEKLSAWKESETSTLTPRETTGEDIETLKERGKAKKGKYRCFNTKTNRKVLEELFKYKHELKEINYVYDGKKNIFTTNRILNLIPTTLTSKDELERECKFEIVIQPVEKSDSKDNLISLEPLNALLQGRSSYIPEEAVLVLETIMRNQPAMFHMPVGRNFFPTFGYRNSFDIPGGRLVRKGYHQSMLLTESKAVLNIDVSATTFYKSGSVIEFLNQMLKMMATERKEIMTELKRLPELTTLQINRLRKELNGCRIYANHFEPRRKYKVHDVSQQSADDLSFEITEGRMISVTDYFREMYKKRLCYGRFPCLKINKNREIYLPLEVCEIPDGEHCLRKPSKLQTAKMIQNTALPPAQRFDEIQKIVDQNIKEFGNQYELFGMTIDRDPVKVIGRLLESPELLYRGSTQKPKDGKWNLVNNKLLVGVSVMKWAILAASSNIGQNLSIFATRLVATARKFGMAMSSQPETVLSPRNVNERADISVLLKKIHEQINDIELVMVVLRSKNDKNYCKIKSVAETELGIITQCLAEENIQDGMCNEQFLANLCLKINSKLGGQNSTISPNTVPNILKESTMIIGADCNHPGPHDDVNHSIAAAVCNLDPEMAQFATAYTIQPREKNKRIELIKKLKHMIIELLQHYIRKTQKYPSRIIFFRDGVSEGEYEKALNEEVPQVLQACKETIRGKFPKLTFLIVNKRHHTRLKVEDPKDGVRPQGNIPPGTKVDTGITHILNFDFFLCSQNGIKGTSRPAHYTVIHDDNNFSSIENKPMLEKLCYFLCHVSCRCTRSVSIPAPVDYAHHAAYRAKQYLLAKIESSALTADEQLAIDLESEIKVMTHISDRMYFI